MLNLRRILLAAMAAATLATAQPALTIIQDTLYRADGTRFNGTMFITWNSFQAGDTTNVATSNLTLPIVNGVLRVSLVPTTTATPGAQYNVTYNSRGINQFSQVWAVPPSTVTLRIRDVLVSQGAIVGPPPVTAPVQITDVTGLQNELAVRPMKGVGFAISRTAIINQAGQIDGAAGTLTDCVHVDGSSGPCGGSGSGGGLVPSFADAEVPQGLVNGANTTFTLAFAPSPAASLQLNRNGLEVLSGVDYLLSGSTITFFITSLPQTGDQLTASYRYANPNNPSGSLTAAQVVCSSTGFVNSSAIDASLGTCTIPQGLLTAGDRLEVRFNYAHSGTTVGFSTTVKAGSTILMTRSSSALETGVVGNTSFSLGTTGQNWNTQAWTSLPAQSLTLGTAAEDITMPLTFDFRGSLASAGGDNLNLVNFSVVRYPAQSNP
jgi:hypothetical protein